MGVLLLCTGIGSLLMLSLSEYKPLAHEGLLHPDSTPFEHLNNYRALKILLPNHSTITILHTVYLLMKTGTHLCDQLVQELLVRSILKYTPPPHHWNWYPEGTRSRVQLNSGLVDEILEQILYRWTLAAIGILGQVGL